MIPYYPQPFLELGGVRLPAFALLMAAAVALGHVLLVRRAVKLGLDGATAGDVSLCLFGGGFAGAILAKALYFPEELLAGTRRFFGFSSFGGLAGGLLAMGLYFILRKRKWTEAAAYLDAVAFVFPMAWMLGRLGCTLAHDHPGMRASGWLTVAYPGGLRYDLGLLELLFTAAAAGLFRWLDRTPRGAGFYLGLWLLLYGPFRAALDLLHVDPPVYFGWPVDRWFGIAAFLCGAFIFSRRIPARSAL